MIIVQNCQKCPDFPTKYLWTAKWDTGVTSTDKLRYDFFDRRLQINVRQYMHLYE